MHHPPNWFALGRIGRFASMCHMSLFRLFPAFRRHLRRLLLRYRSPSFSGFALSLIFR